MQERVTRMEGRPYDPGACLTADDVATAVLGALALPGHVEVKDLSVRPMGVSVAG
jgi:NADP-dependent 3-hydroxy acid dehydrogenase YdfG